MPIIACHKCGSPFEAIDAPMISCPTCGQRYTTGRAAEDDAPIARLENPLPPTTQASSQETDISPIVTSPRWHARFEPRQYPAMQIIIGVLYSLAIAIVLQFLGSVALISTTMFKASPNDSPEAFSSTFAGVLLIGASLVFHSAWVVLFMASAESIRVWLDIQHNTQESAFWSRI